MAADAPVWFITGSSTGFGRELAKLLLARGRRVVATARDPAQASDIVADYPETGMALKLDVTRPDEIDAAATAALEKFSRVDVLVNNAGYGYFAAVEEGDDNEIRAIFETNVFGLAATTRRFMPIFRAQGGGFVVNFSSIGGFVGGPGAGYYNATKFAVEGLSEALAKEAKSLGVKVLIVEPGPFRTDWAGRSLKTPKHSIEAYAEAIARRNLARVRNGAQAGDPVRGAQAIIDVVESADPPLRLFLGAYAVATARAKLDEVRRDIDANEAVSVAADFSKPA